MKKLLVFVGMMLCGVLYAQSYKNPSGHSKPIPRKSNKTELVKTYAIIPKKVDEIELEENKSQFI